jgi:GAF domain-containing protein
VNRLLPLPIARVLLRSWLAHSPDSWRRRVTAVDPPVVHAAGTDPDRVFMVGDGVASGRGVVTHELGLPGYLARSLTAITGNATDVELVVHPDMTLRSCIEAIASVDLRRFDAVLLSVGHNEVLDLMSVARWTSGLQSLLDEVQRRTPVQTQIFVLRVPTFEQRTSLPRPLARAVDERSALLNAATTTLTLAPNVTVIPLTHDNEFEPETRHLYQEWADDMAFHIAKRLDPDRVPIEVSDAIDEEARLRAVAALDTAGLTQDPVLDGITETARQVFAAPIAAITLIRADTQTTKAASGIVLSDRAREGSFCDVTVRRSSHHIVEDTVADVRFAHYAAGTDAPSVRFYAGCPITSPEGHRVGALCVMDDQPRVFSRQDIRQLRALAELAERHLWARSDADD